MHTPILTPTELEALGRKNGWTAIALCREAKIANSTFTRWKSGANGMTVIAYKKMYALASQQYDIEKFPPQSSATTQAAE